VKDHPKIALFLLIFYVVAGLVIVDLEIVYRTPIEAAAVATALALVVIAYQSWQTRAAAAAAERGLIAADRSIEFTQALAAEAEKARLELRAPKLKLLCSAPEWPPFAEGLWSGGPRGQYEEGKVFRMPGASDEPFVLRAEAKLRNEGDRTVRVHINNALVSTPGTDGGYPATRWAPIRPQGYERTLAPNAELRLMVEELRPVSYWVENGLARDKGVPGPHSINCEIIAQDDFDNGVADNLFLELGGFPLERVRGETDSWQIPACLPDNLPIHFIAKPQMRRYFRSKRANQELPDVQVTIQPPKQA
jgi:hypothetical protein